MKHIRLYEEWDWKDPFGKKRRKQEANDYYIRREEERNNKFDQINLLAQEIENEPIVIDILNKIRNGKFTKCKSFENTYFFTATFLLDKGYVVDFYVTRSTEIGMNGFEYDQGDYTLAYMMEVNGESIVDWKDIARRLFEVEDYENFGGTYITSKTFNEIKEIALSWSKF